MVAAKRDAVNRLNIHVNIHAHTGIPLSLYVYIYMHVSCTHTHSLSLSHSTHIFTHNTQYTCAYIYIYICKNLYTDLCTSFAYRYAFLSEMGQAPVAFEMIFYRSEVATQRSSLVKPIVFRSHIWQHYPHFSLGRSPK